MNVLLGILLAFVVFLIVVLIHEFGHFICARLTGMKVEEFGFGIPPKLKSLFRDKHGTEYTFNLLPIGGFVRIYGEDPASVHGNIRHAFMSKNWIQRVLVLIAGVTMNFLLAWVIFTGLFVHGIAPVTIAPVSGWPTHSVILPSFDEAYAMGYLRHEGIELTPLTGSVAESAGIQKWDILLSIDGKIPASPDEVIGIVRASTASGVDFLLQRHDEQKRLHIVPIQWKIGSVVGYKNLNLDKTFIIKVGFVDAVQLGLYETYYSSILTLRFLGDIVHGTFAPRDATEREEAKSMLSGPIGMGVTFVQLVEISAPASLIFLIIALLSINLWVVNLLPFPALDGGRIVSTTLYSITALFTKKKETFFLLEKYFHASGFILLLILMVYVAGLDIGRFF
jgi:regulator of sigma E protease